MRWAAAVAIVVVAILWDLSGRATESAPFAANDIGRGSTIDEDAITWANVPTGLFDTTSPMGLTAAVPIEAGEPITRSMTVVGARVPDGWWTVPVATPASAVSGSRVRVVLPDGRAVDGVVVQASEQDSFGIPSAGLIAVPPEYADIAGVAAASDQLIVLYEP
jgi:hypothetical protein